MLARMSADWGQGNRNLPSISVAPLANLRQQAGYQSARLTPHAGHPPAHH